MEYIQCEECGSWQLKVRFLGVVWELCLSCGCKMHIVEDWYYDDGDGEEHPYDRLAKW